MKTKGSINLDLTLVIAFVILGLIGMVLFTIGSIKELEKKEFFCKSQGGERPLGYGTCIVGDEEYKIRKVKSGYRLVKR